MIANAIARKLFYQVDQARQRFVLFNATIDLHTDGTQIKEGDYFIHISNVNKRRIETTK